MGAGGVGRMVPSAHIRQEGSRQLLPKGRARGGSRQGSLERSRFLSRAPHCLGVLGGPGVDAARRLAMVLLLWGGLCPGRLSFAPGLMQTFAGVSFASVSRRHSRCLCCPGSWWVWRSGKPWWGNGLWGKIFAEAQAGALCSPKMWARRFRE